MVPFELGESVYIKKQGNLVKAVVTRVTKTQVIVSVRGKEYLTKFNRERGYSIGTSSWTSFYIERPSENLDVRYVKQVKRLKLVRIESAIRARLKMTYNNSQEEKDLAEDAIHDAYQSWVNTSR